MATYLELTQRLVAELGIGGADNGATVPTTVAAQTGQLWRAAYWIQQAHNNICLLHVDWDFLYFEYSEALTVGSEAVPAHSGAETPKKWNRSSFYLDLTASTGSQLEWMKWHQFRGQLRAGFAARGNARPGTITQKPDGTLLLDNPSDSAYTLSGEGWKRPTVLSADTDTPDFPEEYHRLIVCEAAIKYGNKEAALEIIQGMEAEYSLILAEMEADQLPDREYDRLAAQDIDLTMEIPGFSDLGRR